MSLSARLLYFDTIRCANMFDGVGALERGKWTPRRFALPRECSNQLSRKTKEPEHIIQLSKKAFGGRRINTKAFTGEVHRKAGEGNRTTRHQGLEGLLGSYHVLTPDAFMGGMGLDSNQRTGC